MKRKKEKKSRSASRAAKRARDLAKGRTDAAKRAGEPSAVEAIAAALEHHRAGRLQEAEAAYRAVLEREPAHPDANNLLGMIALDTGYAREAATLFEQAVAAGPGIGAYHLNLGNALQAIGAHERAAACFERAIACDPAAAGAHHNLGLLRMMEGRDEEALRCFREAMRIAPGDASSAYLAAALSGEARATAPREYVEMLFDTYAGQFDRHLAQLQYDIPARLRALVDRCADTAGAAWTVLDLGCGTGQSGAAFRDLSARLVGCDLSAGMLRHAAERQIYDELRQVGLVELLGSCEHDADLVIAADVMIYVGELTETFAACRRALRPGGLLAFSVESLEGEHFALRRTGRFAHSERYVARLCEEAGFEVAGKEEAVIRKDSGRDIPGHVYALRSPG